LEFYGKCISSLELLLSEGKVFIEGGKFVTGKEDEDYEHDVSGPAWFFYVHLVRFANPELTEEAIMGSLIDGSAQISVSLKNLNRLLDNSKTILRLLLKQ